MVKKDIREGNKLIAEFMGFKYFPYKKEIQENSKTHNLVYQKFGWRLKNGDPNRGLHIKFTSYPTDFKDTNYLGRSHNDLKYNSSWDWLIPVIKIIRNTKEFKELDIIPIEFGDDNMIKGLIIQDINTTHKGVIQYIKWYNKKLQKYDNSN